MKPEPSVYFIASADLSRVKIGRTKDPLDHRGSRFTSLQWSSPEQLLLVADVLGYAYVEKFFHREFHKFRLHGEWFVANPDLDALIRRIQCDGRRVSFDVCPGPLAADVQNTRWGPRRW